MDNETFTAYIYQIYDHLDGLRYIGSTIKDIKQRLKQHESDYRKYKRGTYHFVTSFNILCNRDYDISILETVEVDSVRELRKIEGKYIQIIDCVNKHVAGREINESYKLSNKRYRERNKHTKHNYDMLYREANKELIRVKKNAKHKCDCGGKYTNGVKARHMKSQKHLQYMKSLNEIEVDF